MLDLSGPNKFLGSNQKVAQHVDTISRVQANRCVARRHELMSRGCPKLNAKAHWAFLC